MSEKRCAPRIAQFIDQKMISLFIMQWTLLYVKFMMALSTVHIDLITTLLPIKFNKTLWMKSILIQAIVNFENLKHTMLQ